uniref:Uncharacterized protein n=1 Tax=Anguilla anguilla TaxID=7936 RepID=A0A0E9W759_ANGAN
MQRLILGILIHKLWMPWVLNQAQCSNISQCPPMRECYSSPQCSVAPPLVSRYLRSAHSQWVS